MLLGTRLRRLLRLKENLGGSPSRRAAYFSLAQAAYSCLAGTFEIPMALRLAGRVEYVVLVYAFYYSTIMAGFLLGLGLVREGKASRLFRLELGLLSGLNLGVALLYSKMTGIPALALYFLVRGLAEGLYWAARHRTMIWAVQDAGRDGFALRLQSLSVTVSVILPLVAGALISLLGAGRGAVNPFLPPGYVPVFLFSSLILALAALASPRLEIGRNPLSFRRSFSFFREREIRRWKSYIALGSIGGSCFTVSAGILTFGILKTEFRIGAFNALVALLSALSFALLGRFLAGRKGARLGGALVGSVADILSRSIYCAAPNAAGLMAKALLDAFAVPLKSLLNENVNLAYIERLCARSGASHAEVYLFRESVIWVSRSLFCAFAGGGLALASALGWGLAADPARGARFLLGFSAAFPLAEYLFIRSFARDNARAEASGPELGLPAEKAGH
jgi:hypothetical protein